MFQEHCKNNGIELKTLEPKRQAELYNEFLSRKKDNGQKEKQQNIMMFKNKGITENFLNLVQMANYLISKGHNNETFNPFKYPINKLIRTFKIAKLNDAEDKGELLYSQIAAIASAFGDKDSVLYFEKVKEQIKRKL